MDSRESSDDEEDQQTLIHQNDTRRTKSSPRPPRRSTFHIDEFDNPSTTSTNRRLPSSFNKRYLFAIFLPLLFVLAYFTTDLKSLFQSSASNVNFDASVNRMRESELQALFLLRNQQLGLLELWNQTFSNQSSTSTSNHSSIDLLTPSYEHVKSALLAQISLNKQIQHALLSSHQLGNSLDLEDSNRTDPSLTSFDGLNRCRKLDSRFSERRTIEWKPKSNKYLFAICVSGQMSNHLICLEKHMFFAAVLNRVLVIPSSKVDYEFSRVLDIDHINKCLGRKVVVTFEEFAEIKKNHLHIDRVICYFSLPTPCFVDDDHIKKLKALGVSVNKLEPAWVEDVKKPTLRTIQDVMSKFSSDDDVIAIGDVFFADVEKEWVMQPGGPIAHKCKTLIEPSRLIMLTAQRFVQTFLGEGFIALHFRRHGFLKFW